MVVAAAQMSLVTNPDARQTEISLENAGTTQTHSTTGTNKPGVTLLHPTNPHTRTIILHKATSLQQRVLACIHAAQDVMPCHDSNDTAI